MQHWTVTKDNLDEIAEKSGRLLEFYERELENATNRNQWYVVYLLNGEWKQLFIDREYNVDFVMEVAHRWSQL